jgi:ribosomal protein RSM22 (predicted rRNA methylase)
MQLPPRLREAIEQELESCDGAQLRAAAARLSVVYREAGERTDAASKAGNSAAGAMIDDVQRAAYLAVRMPATFAAVAAALGWTREACCKGEHHEESGEENGDIRDGIRTVLDLGSGPGTALWAAAQLFPTLDSCTALERDPRLIELGRRLAAHSEDYALRGACWLRGDLTAELPPGSWDLVVCSYALNEVAEERRAELIRQAWARCNKLLLVVEPGTRAGFANVLAVRNQMLASGAAVLAAPCPHALACPMAAQGDWCHFAARVERTASHRRLKDATLGHEDEKFSYVAFLRNPAIPNVQAPARVVRHPRLFSGYAQLTLCREGEIAKTTVTRSQKEDWRRLKRLGWGDAW